MEKTYPAVLRSVLEVLRMRETVRESQGDRLAALIDQDIDSMSGVDRLKTLCRAREITFDCHSLETLFAQAAVLSGMSLREFIQLEIPAAVDLMATLTLSPKFEPTTTARNAQAVAVCPHYDATRAVRAGGKGGVRTLKLPYDPSDWIKANFDRGDGWWDNMPFELRLPWEYATKAIALVDSCSTSALTYDGLKKEVHKANTRGNMVVDLLILKAVEPLFRDALSRVENEFNAVAQGIERLERLSASCVHSLALKVVHEVCSLIFSAVAQERGLIREPIQQADTNGVRTRVVWRSHDESDSKDSLEIVVHDTGVDIEGARTAVGPEDIDQCWPLVREILRRHKPCVRGDMRGEMEIRLQQELSRANERRLARLSGGNEAAPETKSPAVLADDQRNKQDTPKPWRPKKDTRHVIELMKKGLSDDEINDRSDVKVEKSAVNLRQIRSRARKAGMLPAEDAEKRDTP